MLGTSRRLLQLLLKLRHVASKQCRSLWHNETFTGTGLPSRSTAAIRFGRVPCETIILAANRRQIVDAKPRQNILPQIARDAFRAVVPETNFLVVINHINRRLKTFENPAIDAGLIEFGKHIG